MLYQYYAAALTKGEHKMKRFGLYAATAIVTLGVSSAAAVPAHANISSFTVCNPGNFSGNNCGSLQDILFGLSNSCLSAYSCPTTYSCPTSSSCPATYSCNNSCLDEEEYFPNQGGNTLWENYFPDIIFPGNNNNSQNNSQGSTSADTSSNTAYIRQIVNLVNEERAKAGLSPVTESSALSKAAYTRAQEISRNFSHTRPNGSYFSSILQQNGLSYISTGENIAYGQRTAQEVMNGWMNSASHRANILNPNYTTIGVGFYQGSNGTNYWSQLFIR